MGLISEAEFRKSSTNSYFGGNAETRFDMCQDKVFSHKMKESF